MRREKLKSLNAPCALHAFRLQLCDFIVQPTKRLHACTMYSHSVRLCVLFGLRERMCVSVYTGSVFPTANTRTAYPSHSITQLEQPNTKSETANDAVETRTVITQFY